MKLNHIDTNLQELSRAEAQEITGGNEAPTFRRRLRIRGRMVIRYGYLPSTWNISWNRCNSPALYLN